MLYRSCPGLLLESPNATSAVNLFTQQKCFAGREFGIKTINDGTNNTNANVFLRPFYNANSGTAIIDEGNQNMWLWTHVEYADVVAEMHGHSYRLIEENWDRLGDYTNTVVEKGNVATGEIWVTDGFDAYGLMRLQSPGTIVRGMYREGTNNAMPVHDKLRNWWGGLPVTPLEVSGFNETSSGGSVSSDYIGPGPKLTFTTSNDGDVASVNQGGNWLRYNRNVPKLLTEIELAQNPSNALVRYGFFRSSGDRCELIYDPNDVLGGHGTNNWYWEFLTGGTTRFSQELSVGPSTGDTQKTCLQREDPRQDAVWSVSFEGSVNASAGNGGTIMNNGQMRISVEQVGSNPVEFVLDGRRGARLWST